MLSPFLLQEEVDAPSVSLQLLQESRLREASPQLADDGFLYVQKFFWSFMPSLLEYLLKSEYLLIYFADVWVFMNFCWII